jgi:hypothetical protein
MPSPSKFQIDDYFPTNFAQSEHLGNGPISRAGTINPKIRASIQRVHPEVCLLNAQLERSRKVRCLRGDPGDNHLLSTEA